MRNLFVLIPFLMLVASCSDEKKMVDKLEQIKNVGNDDPALALRMMDSISYDIEEDSRYARMKYDLLKVRLKDKAYIPATSDVKIKQLVEYFTEYGSAKEKQEVFYYAGSVYRDLDDTPRSIENFYHSLNICEQEKASDSVLLRNTFSNLYWQYYSVQDYSNALKMAKKEYSIAKKINLLDASTILHVGTSCIRLGHDQEALNYFLQALDLWDKTADADCRREVLSSLLYHFSVLKKEAKAQECHELIMKEGLDKLLIPDDYLALGLYYRLCNHTDSAIMCYQKTLNESDKLQGKYDASKILFLIYNSKGDRGKANVYADDFIRISDTLNLGERQRLATTVNNKYKYHINKNREEKNEKAAAFYQRLTIIVLVTACFAGLLLLLFCLYRRNQHLKEITDCTHTIMLAEKEIDGLKRNLAEKEERLMCQRETLDKVKTELSDVTIQIKKYEIALHEREQLLEEKMDQNKSILKLIHQSELGKNAENVISDIRMSAKGIRPMSDSDWTNLFNAVNKLYPSFSDMLTQKLGKINDQELQICYLMQIGLTNPDIQKLTNLSRTTVWRWTKKFDWIENINQTSDT